MDYNDLESHFVDLGGQFVLGSYKIQQALENVEAYVFDWDGVFNDGRKGPGLHSGYTETDASGLRLLRYAHYRATGKIPHLVIITGAENPAAAEMLERMHGDALYSKAIPKDQALQHFCESAGISPKQCVYSFDDTLDLSVARLVAVRFCIGRLATPMFTEYVIQNDLADYITACQGNEFAVREISELLIGLLGQAEEAFEHASRDSEDYQNFKKALREHELAQFSMEAGQILPRGEQ